MIFFDVTAAEYPDHVVVFYVIGLHATVWTGVYAVVFSIDRTVTALLRRRRARTAKEAS